MSAEVEAYGGLGRGVSEVKVMCEPDQQLSAALARLDLTSADGRAGIRSLLAKLERQSPDVILQSADRVQRNQLDTARR